MSASAAEIAIRALLRPARFDEANQPFQLAGWHRIDRERDVSETARGVATDDVRRVRRNPRDIAHGKPERAPVHDPGLGRRGDSEKANRGKE
jgi:hypothetical protein